MAAAPTLLPADPAVAAQELPDFPADVALYRSAYRNWVGEITADGLWACAPADPDQVVTVVNWAWRHGWRVRARGSSHGWSPLTITQDTESDAPVLLVDTASHLTGLSLESPTSVRAGTGVTLEALLTYLEEHGLGVTAAPAPGNLTLGGALAIGAHGTAVPARGEQRSTGHTYGSLSNLVLSLTAVVWDEDSGAYVLRTYDRDEADCAALLTHLGRSLVTEVVLRAGANTNLRCVSRTDISAGELFAAPGTDGRTLASFLDRAGRVEAIWFAFTEFPWLKVWSVSPTRPLTSRHVTTPYNYPFSDSVPTPVADLVGRMASEGAWYLAPVLGNAQYDVAALGLVATLSADIWGPSKNTLLYLRPTTLRIATNGYAVLTSRDRVQRVVAEFTAFYRERLTAYADRGRFPVNGSVEIRVTGLDEAADVGVDGARTPLLSALGPRDDRPEWDTVVWLNILSLPGTPYAEAFLSQIERFLLRTFDGEYAMTRVEWSKGWAYTRDGAWSDGEVLGAVVPGSFGEDVWGRAAGVLDRLDPHGVFGNAFLDRLFR
ncbi:MULTISPECIES: cholesterol oxidase substrate-binding domain-containing protein [unclassified Streptomyces]|uniref:cholesterol oxidase substrate-binding domain-containing protein n=1 Tax=unclassified Streptomyces TaxID=2593676 RepID=UPI0023667487|nr:MULTISPECIES: cholesterol oxidase substrate-binding domain-containing protein [unclassified Streptomyces]MDF3145089.1 cholesterol oxidase substrate-binding domain-containing protein [Streptomyces sp. T21Q-yed]WDF44965.1 cholesterol oxidase substrate-binding domain-containing protein [Streptomyces sp. T12]